MKDTIRQVTKMAKDLNFTKLNSFNILALTSTHMLNCASEVFAEQGSCSVSEGYVYTKGIPNKGEHVYSSAHCVVAYANNPSVISIVTKF